MVCDRTQQRSGDRIHNQDRYIPQQGTPEGAHSEPRFPAPSSKLCQNW